MSKKSATTARWRRPVLWVALSVPMLVLLYVGMLVATLPPESGEEVGFSDFRQRVEAGQVESAVLLNFDNLVLFRSDGRQFRAVLPANENTVSVTLERVLASGVPLEVDQQRFKGLILPATYIIPGMVLISVILLVFLLQRSNNGVLKSAARRGATEKPITFDDVAGADEAVAEIREVVDFLREPERFRSFGAEPPRGILLVGPPGTGKTLLARAVAGEAGVPFFSISGTEFVEMWVGVGAARVRDLFRKVRESAPAILFIDELDAAGRARAGSATAGQEERDQTLNQLLVEMDGFDTFSGVVLMGATNRPDVLDPALLRRGRFDRQIVVDRADRAGRAAVLKVHARGKRLDPSVDLETLARQTPGFTGADLASVMNEAALLAARRHKPAIGVVELEEAVDRVIAGNERKARILTAEEKRAVAYHEAGHAIVAWALPGTDPVTKISVVSRGQALGLTWMVPEEERFLVSRSEYVSRMAVSMGGMAAEEIVLGETTSGPRDDLRRATVMARRMVCELGMSDAVGKVALGRDVGSPYLGGDVWQVDYSDQVAAEVDREIRRVTNEAFELARVVLEANRDLLDELAAALIESETIREPEISRFAQAVVHPGESRSSRRAAHERLAIRPLQNRQAGTAGGR
ncbi:MAG: ATP-dependent zinc metalloprotease FtsH [Actinomycetota bacterium]|nr:ATP-dependent zinc metalloprotease FtsH [Actinomycetota bacterium]